MRPAKKSGNAPAPPAYLPYVAGAALGLVAASVIAVIVLLSGGTPSVTANVDMYVSSGTVADVYTNDFGRGFYRLPVQPGQRFQYVFDLRNEDLETFRLDPTDDAGATVRIYSIEINCNDTTVRRVTGSELAKWDRYNLRDAQMEGEAFRFTSTNRDPYVMTHFALTLLDKLPRTGSTGDSGAATAKFVLGWFALSLLATFILKRTTRLWSAPESLARCSAAILWLSVLVGCYIATGTSVLLWKSAAGRVIGYYIGQMDSLLAIFTVAVLVLVAAGVTHREGRLHLAVAAVVWPSSYFLVKAIAGIECLPPSIHRAIGFANYMGYGKSSEVRAVMAACAWALVAGALMWWVLRRARLLGSSIAEPEAGASNWRPWIPVAFGVAIIAAYYQPSLSNWFTYYTSHTFERQGWDETHNLIWQYMIHAGATPIRDFWFPYGGLYLQGLHFPFERIYHWVQLTLLLGGLFTGLTLVFRMRVLAAALAFLPLWVATDMGALTSIERYMVGANLLLFYAAIDRDRRAWQPAHALLALYAGLTMFLDPAQFIYVLPAIAIHTVWRTGWQLSQLPGEIADRLRREALPCLVAVLLPLGWFAAHGMLPGLWMFFRTLGDQSAYAANPAPAAGWVSAQFTKESVFLVLLVAGPLFVFDLLRGGRNARVVTLAGLLITCGGMMCMQKQAVRPHIAQQVLIFAALAVALYCASIWHRRTLLQTAVMGLLCGACFGFGVRSGAVSRMLGTTLTSPATAITNLSYWTDSARIQRVADGRFSPERYRNYRDEYAAIDAARRVAKLTEASNIYVLGDESIFYVILRKYTPYHVSNYLRTPLSQQRIELQWLEAKQPEVVFWNPSIAIFDSVPHLVRVPLIYDYVMEHYAPAAEAGPYQILVRRQPGAAIDVDFWRRHLGESVHLGNLPWLTEPRDYRACEGAGDCVDMIHVAFDAPPREGLSGVSIQDGARRYQIRFNVTPKSRDYWIRADRVWFWKSLSADARQAVSAMSPGARVETTSRARRADVLY